MKIEDFIAQKPPKSISFVDRMGGFNLYGDGKLNPKLTLLVPKKDGIASNFEAIKQDIVVIPFGYREQDNYDQEGYTVSKHGSKSISFDRQLCVFSLLLNTNPETPECAFGLLLFNIAEVPKLMQLANLCDGRHIFYFDDVMMEKTPAESSISPMLIRYGTHRTEYERITNLERKNSAIALWTVLKRQLVSDQAIFLSARAEESLLTRDQHAALASFVRLVCTIEYSVDFYGFTPALDEMDKMMEMLATIDRPTIKGWFEQYINELLLHEMADVRTIARYYVDAQPQES